MAYEDLTGKQRLFVDAYLGHANCNATEAARMAGYACPDPQGRENLRKPTIRAAIDERMRAAAIGADEILARLVEHARADYARFFVVDGGEAGIDLEGMKNAGLMRLVKKISYDKQGRQVIEFHDTQAALLALAKRYDLFPDHTKHSGQVTIDAVLNALPEPIREGVRGALAEAVRGGGVPAGGNGKR